MKGIGLEFGYLFSTTVRQKCNHSVEIGVQSSFAISNIGEKGIVLSVKGSIKLLSGVCLSKSFSVYFLKISYIKEVSPKSYGGVRNNTESTYVFFPEKIKYINGSFQKSSLSETIH